MAKKKTTKTAAKKRAAVAPKKRVSKRSPAKKTAGRRKRGRAESKVEQTDFVSAMHGVAVKACVSEDKKFIKLEIENNLCIVTQILPAPVAQRLAATLSLLLREGTCLVDEDARCQKCGDAITTCSGCVSCA